jgi:hypothetical protein
MDYMLGELSALYDFVDNANAHLVIYEVRDFRDKPLNYYVKLSKTRIISKEIHR